MGEETVSPFTKQILLPFKIEKFQKFINTLKFQLEIAVLEMQNLLPIHI